MIVDLQHEHHHQAPAAPVSAPAPQAADPHAHHRAPASAPPPALAPADPHAGHKMPGPEQAAPQSDPHAGHHMHHAMPATPAATTAPPPIPTDHAAERFYSPAVMAAARAQLMKEHGGGTAWIVRADVAEQRFRKGDDAQAFEGQAWWGTDASKWVVKARGEHVDGHGWEKAELEGLKAWPIGPYFDLQAGVRYDLAPKGRAYAAVGFEGLAPYWFELHGAAYVSDRGDVSARAEASYDLRLTQRLILQPRLEADLAEAGAGRLEGGLRLRYEIKREFAPYVGVVRERAFGPAREAGERAGATAVVIGVSAWR
ncbi:copper resistance protein B [Caulobacter vibrioides]|uniref:copper resistance protein B n=1 Tax=Caulobacter vibrioides TaxID=155892 RepID=UPI000BB4C112|nr:copper resistance protein B [Caulobacter vibrioides]ATC23923.1 copper-binding protein [Caulobacter vibrioides]PLR15868.1 copper-binding protein [Caulobacter vibrioides]